MALHNQICASHVKQENNMNHMNKSKLKRNG